MPAVRRGGSPLSRAAAASPARPGCPGPRSPRCAVPEVPGVRARAQPGGELHAVLPSGVEEPSVHAQQLVLGAAVQEQGRQRCGIGSGQQAAQVVLGTGEIASRPDPLGEMAGVQLQAQRRGIQRPGEARGGGEALRMVQRQLERPEAAHRQARDEGVLPGGGDAEGAGDQLRQLLGDEGPVRLPHRLVGVEGAAHLGHHHRDALLGRVPFDRGAPFPDGAVIAEPVQQVEHGHPTVLALGIGPAGGPVHPDAGRGLRHQHHHRGAHAEGFGEEVGAQADHRSSLLGRSASACGRCRAH